MDIEKLLTAAAHSVDMFDQANTNKSIEALGDRGQLLADAIKDLREIVNRDGQRTILP